MPDPALNAAMNARIGARPAAKRRRPAAGSPRRRAAAPESDSDSAEEADEGDEQEDAEEPDPPRPAKKRARGAEPRRCACKACAADFPREEAVGGLYCPACDLIYTSSAESTANKLRAAKLLGTAAPGPGGSVQTSQSDTNSSGSAKPKLSAYESELRRLLDMAGTDRVLPRFQQAEAIGHADAIAAQRRTFVGSSFARQSEWLTKLIRSGHFKELSLALPITNADDLRRRTAESKGGRIKLDANGVLGHEAETAVERPLTDLCEFLKVIVVTLLPTLFDRPRAMLDWLELARSVVDIDHRHKWDVARSYLMDLLSDRVPTGAPFNQFDGTILQAAVAQRMEPAGAAGARRDQQQQPQQQQRAPDPWRDECAPGTCRDWNAGPRGCVRDSCQYSHRCMWKACPTPEDGHRGKDCRKQPAGYQAQAGRRPAGGGQQRRADPRRK